ncbi:MAG: redoxin domain-containing protein [Armatimonadetes bacterium]|nr:redoxin domain-containing protein [Armatimonadota bacterium]
MALSAGTKAPLFTLRQKTADGMRDVSLADHAGQDVVVLLFVPGAFTHVCTGQFCDLSKGVTAIPGAVTYGVSVDSAYCQEAWGKMDGITLPMISDFTHQVTKDYDVVLESLSGMGPASKRAAFVIDRDGMIVYSEETPTTLDMVNYEAINAAVSAAK